MIYSVKDVMEMLDVSESTVRRWIKNGELVGKLYCDRDGYYIDENAMADLVTIKPKYRKAYLASKQLKDLENKKQPTYSDLLRMRDKQIDLLQKIRSGQI